MPLMFDPGERWEYGINIDWVGRLVEEASGQSLDAYFAEHITGPLGMKDTGFTVSLEQRTRQEIPRTKTTPSTRAEAAAYAVRAGLTDRGGNGDDNGGLP